MKMMDNKGKFNPGTRFRGNMSGAVFEVLKIENKVATVRDTKTGMTINYGLRALEKCNLTILENAEDGK